MPERSSGTEAVVLTWSREHLVIVAGEEMETEETGRSRLTPGRPSGCSWPGLQLGSPPIGDGSGGLTGISGGTFISIQLQSGQKNS